MAHQRKTTGSGTEHGVEAPVPYEATPTAPLPPHPPPQATMEGHQQRSLFLQSFLEASLPTGQWEAALVALATHQHNGSHVVAASRVQFRAGMWRNCLRLVHYFNNHHVKCHSSPFLEGNSEVSRCNMDLQRSTSAAPDPKLTRTLRSLQILAVHALCQSGGGRGQPDHWELGVRLCAQLVVAAPSAPPTSQRHRHGHRGHEHPNDRVRDLERIGAALSMVIPGIPHDAVDLRKALSQERWRLLEVSRTTKSRLGELSDRRSDSLLQKTAVGDHGRGGSGSGLDVMAGNMKLTQILRYGPLNNSTLARRNRLAWAEALQVFRELRPHPSTVSYSILAKILGNYRRDAELVGLLQGQLPLPSTVGGGLSSSAASGKAFGEAAFECHSWRAGLTLLMLDDIRDADDSFASFASTPAPTTTSSSASFLRSMVATPLAPSAAIPALIALRQNKHAWHYALAWWWRQGGSGGRATVPSTVPATTASQLCLNQKVSSYVAQHIAVGTHPHLLAPLTPKSSTHAVPHLSWYWQTALEIVASTSHVHPARAVLFGLQALQLSSCWVKAVELYQCKQDFLLEEGAQELPSIHQILCDERARRWIPGDMVWALRRATWWKPEKKGRWC